MKYILLSEWERTFKRKKTWAGIIIYILLITLECCFLYAIGGRSFYNPDDVVMLNSLNTSPFFFRELGIFLIFILIPMFVVDSFNGEYTSGAYRLVLLRPKSVIQLYISKLFVQGLILFGLLFLTFLISNIYGHIVFPDVKETTFYNTSSITTFQSYIYILVFYSIAYSILFTVLIVGSLISILMPNSILSYITILLFLIGIIYISDKFTFFLTPSDSIFEVMGGQNDTLILIVFSLIIFSFIINILIANIHSAVWPFYFINLE